MLNSIKNNQPKADEVILHQNHPNPFNLSTLIPYTIDLPGDATLQIHDLDGKLIYQQTQSHSSSGDKHFRYLSSDLIPGTYIYSLLFNNGYSTVRLRRSMIFKHH